MIEKKNCVLIFGYYLSQLAATPPNEHVVSLPWPQGEYNALRDLTYIVYL